MREHLIRHTHTHPDHHTVSDQTTVRHRNIAGVTVDRIQYCTCGRSRLVKTMPDGTIRAYSWV